MTNKAQKRMTKVIAVGIALIFIISSISTVIRMLAFIFKNKKIKPLSELINISMSYWEIK